MQHLAGSEQRDGLAAHKHAAQPNIGRHRVSDRVVFSRRASQIAVLIVAGAGLCGCVLWLAVADTSAASRPGSRSAIAPPDSAAADWIRTNLPLDVRFLTDGPAAPAGYSAVSVASAVANWRNYGYLMTASTTAPSPREAVAVVWRFSTAVAVFESMQVRRIMPMSTPDQIRRDRDADRADRLRAGDALQKNAAVTLSPHAKAILANGELDLRAAAVVSALAGQLPVMLNDIGVVSAEAAAGMPARSITIYTSDPTRAIRLLGGVAPPLAPDAVNIGENGAVALRWPLSVTPIPSIN
jgi:hypothetical protein